MNCGTPNCKRQVEFNEPTDWAPEGWWTHTEALPGTFHYLECFPTGQGPYAVANLAPPAAAPAPAAAPEKLPPSAEVEGDPKLYSRARAAELIAEVDNYLTGGPRPEPALWMGHASEIMRQLLADLAGQSTARPDCEDCQTTAGCRCNEGNR